MSNGLVLGLSASSSGIYNLNGGLLLVGSGGLTNGPGAAAFNFGGGTLGAITPWSSSVSMNLTEGGGDSTVDTTGGSISLSGNLTGIGGLTKTGDGLLILSGSNSYRGNTIVALGTLDVTNSEALPDGVSLTVGAGGKLIFDSSMAGGSPIISSAISPNAVPEPGTLALLGVAVCGAAVHQRVCSRRKKR
ncbi:MAG: autotransporter-associated beta strand repeat-containing protein [Thermoguttaceae bacterium]